MGRLCAIMYRQGRTNSNIVSVFMGLRDVIRIVERRWNHRQNHRDRPWQNLPTYRKIRPFAKRCCKVFYGQPQNFSTALRSALGGSYILCNHHAWGCGTPLATAVYSRQDCASHRTARKRFFKSWLLLEGKTYGFNISNINDK